MTETITLTREELTDIIQGTVKSTLVEMGLKASSLRSGRIYRSEMIEILGNQWRFDKAVKSGNLSVHKDGNRTSKVWARREDWERFLQLHTNRKI